MLLIICASSKLRNEGTQPGSPVGLQDFKVTSEIGKLEIPAVQIVHLKASRLFIDRSFYYGNKNKVTKYQVAEMVNRLMPISLTLQNMICAEEFISTH
jgi:hypothetical protein